MVVVVVVGEWYMWYGKWLEQRTQGSADLAGRLEWIGHSESHGGEVSSQAEVAEVWDEVRPLKWVPGEERGQQQRLEGVQEWHALSVPLRPFRPSGPSRHSRAPKPWPDLYWTVGESLRRCCGHSPFLLGTLWM